MFIQLQDLLKGFAAYIALGLETFAALIIAGGAIEAAYLLTLALLKEGSPHVSRKAVWQRFAMWLILGLEFELAADILRTGISPTWTDIGQLASIAAIRTFLNYFLEKDIEHTGQAI